MQCVGGLPSAQEPSLQHTVCIEAMAVAAVEEQRLMVGSWLTCNPQQRTVQRIDGRRLSHRGNATAQCNGGGGGHGRQARGDGQARTRSGRLAGKAEMGYQEPSTYGGAELVDGAELLLVLRLGHADRRVADAVVVVVG